MANKNSSAICRLQMGLIVTLFINVLLPARAEAQTLLLGGIQRSAQSSYDYLGLIQPIAGGDLGHGFYIQAFASYLQYQYQTSAEGIGVLVHARSPGISAGLGYDFTAGPLQLSVSGSVAYQYFSLTPPIPAGGPFQSSVTFIPQLQVHLPIGDGFYFSGLGSYAFGQGSYWSRMRLGMPTLPWLHFGPEFIPSGGRTYSIRQYGAFVDANLSGGWEVTLEGGLQRQKNLPDVGYAALSLSKTF